jgi:hypothetical protein
MFYRHAHIFTLRLSYIHHRKRRPLPIIEHEKEDILVAKGFSEFWSERAMCASRIPRGLEDARASLLSADKKVRGLRTKHSASHWSRPFRRHEYLLLVRPSICIFFSHRKNAIKMTQEINKRTALPLLLCTQFKMNDRKLDVRACVRKKRK